MIWSQVPGCRYGLAVGSWATASGRSPGVGVLPAPRWRVLGVGSLVHAVVSEELGQDVWTPAPPQGDVFLWATGACGWTCRTWLSRLNTCGWADVDGGHLVAVVDVSLHFNLARDSVRALLMKAVIRRRNTWFLRVMRPEPSTCELLSACRENLSGSEC